MFSGIVQEVGIVKNIEFSSGILELTISAGKIISDFEIGNSIAIDGCCQTVVEVSKNLFKVQATEETLQKTNLKLLKKDSKVNLEPSLKLGDKIDGHLVSGHIDSCGEVLEIISQDENQIIRILFPRELNNYIVPKGSVSVNGVSLTVIESKNNIFSFTLIPYTRNNTNLGLLKVSDPVNLEVDLIGRYLVNYLENTKELIKR